MQSSQDNATDLWRAEFLFSVNVTIWASNLTATLRDTVFVNKFGTTPIFGRLDLIPFGACLTPNFKKDVDAIPASGKFVLTLTWPDDSVVDKAFLGSHLRLMNSSLEILDWEPTSSDGVQDQIEMWNSYNVFIVSTSDKLSSLEFFEFYVSPQLFCTNEIVNSSRTVQVIDSVSVVASECRVDDTDLTLPLPTGPLKSFQIRIICSREYFDIRKIVSSSELANAIEGMYESEIIDDSQFLVEKWKREATIGFEVTCSLPSDTMSAVSFVLTPDAFNEDSFDVQGNVPIQGMISVYASAECEQPIFSGPEIVAPNRIFEIQMLFPKQTYTSLKEIQMYLDPSAPIGGYPSILRGVTAEKTDSLTIANSSFYNNFTISLLSSNITERIGYAMLSWLVDAETCHDFVTDQSKLIFASYNITILSDGPPPDSGHSASGDDKGKSTTALGAGDIVAIACGGVLLLAICIFTLLYFHTLKDHTDHRFLYIDVERTTVPPDYIPMRESEANWVASGER